MPIRLHVQGDFACFTRPEMKVERVSYEVMTPSAARGILEAIYWKPQIAWVVERIHVLKPIRFTNIRRNEVAAVAGRPSKAHLAGGEQEALALYIEDNRQQRAATLLRDVAYVIEARFDVLDSRFERGGKPMPANESAGKHLEMFSRRARQGQCFQQPYFGTREFPVQFRLIEQGDPLPPSELPEGDRHRALGYLLHDFAYLPGDKKGDDSFQDGSGKWVRALPRFFDARLQDGVLHVPPLHQTKG